MDVVYAATNSVVAHAGLRIRINAGEVWSGDDPVVAHYPDMFSDTPKAVRVSTNPHGWSEVEQATREPGEKSAAMNPERARLLDRLAELGVRVRANASLDTLREKVVEAEAALDE